jgi:hypothetical protein
MTRKEIKLKSLKTTGTKLKIDLPRNKSDWSAYSSSNKNKIVLHRYNWKPNKTVVHIWTGNETRQYCIWLFAKVIDYCVLEGRCTAGLIPALLEHSLIYMCMSDDLKSYLNWLKWKLGQLGQCCSQGGSFHNIRLGKIGLGDISRPETWDWDRLVYASACTPRLKYVPFVIDTKPAFIIGCPCIYTYFCCNFLLFIFPLQIKNKTHDGLQIVNSFLNSEWSRTIT